MAARQVRHRLEPPLLPQQPIRVAGEVAHLEGVADHAPALAHGAQRRRHVLADGREQDRGVEALGRRLVRAARPHRAETARERLAREVPRAREREYRPPLPARHLQRDVARGVDAIDAEAPRLARELEHAPADEPRAEERRELNVGALLAERPRDARVGDGRARESAVARVATVKRRVAQVLVAGEAVGAEPAGVAEPGHADARAGREAHDAGAERVDTTDDAAPRDHGQQRVREDAVDDVKVRGADAAGADLDPHLPGTRAALRELAPLERRADPRQPHRLHGTSRRGTACIKAATVLLRCARTGASAPPAAGPAGPRR